VSSKLNLALAVLLILSCLALVKSAYESRRVFAALDQAQREQRALDAEYKRLDAERQAQATPRLVEKVAREKLRMSTVTPGVTAYVDDVPASAPAAVRP
jgi:cell division protein FtsL